MKETKKRAFSWLLILVMVFSVISPGSVWKANAQKSYDGYVYVTVERFTLGQGFAEEPVKLGYYKEDTLEDILKRNLGEKMIYVNSTYGAYFNGYVDGGEPTGWTTAKIPEKIRQALEKKGVTINGRANAKQLSGGDYTGESTFMICVDNAGANMGMSGIVYSDTAKTDTTYHDGSVIRIEYGIYNWSDDLNISYNTPMIEFANKDDLIKSVADYTGNEADTAYENAIDTLEDWDATTKEVESAKKKLAEAEKKPAATSIRTAKSTKKKQMKVTWKKNSKATGYQIQVSTSSKFKKSKTNIYTVKKAKTTSKTIKSLKSKKKYYVRIRTYKKTKENGKTVTRYSTWSDKKTVKVK